MIATRPCIVIYFEKQWIRKELTWTKALEVLKTPIQEMRYVAS